MIFFTIVVYVLFVVFSSIRFSQSYLARSNSEETNDDKTLLILARSNSEETNNDKRCL